MPWQVVHPPVCLPVCNAEVLWSHRLEFLENNFTTISPTFPVSTDPTLYGSTPNGTPQISAGRGVGYAVWKKMARRTKLARSPKGLKIEQKLLLMPYIKSYRGFRLPPRCMTLNDLWVRFKVIDSSNAAKMMKYSLVNRLQRHVVWLEALIISIRPVFMCPCVHVLQLEHILVTWN